MLWHHPSCPPFRGIGHEIAWHSPLPTKSKRDSSSKSEAPLTQKASSSAHPCPTNPSFVYVTIMYTGTHSLLHSHIHPSHKPEGPWGALVLVLLLFCFGFLYLLCFHLKSVFRITLDIFFHVINSTAQGAYKDFLFIPVCTCFSKLVSMRLAFIDQFIRSLWDFAYSIFWANSWGSSKDAWILGLSRLFIDLLKREIYMTGGRPGFPEGPGER